MDTAFSFIILCEVLSALLLIWGFSREQRVVEFENRVLLLILKRLEAKKRQKEATRRERLNREVVYTPVRPAAPDRDPDTTAA